MTPTETPSPQPKSPFSDLPPNVSTDESRRRLIIIAVVEGEDIEVDFDGAFAWWELNAALQRALDITEAEQFADEAENEEED